MRFYFYTISGIVSALLGWSLSQIFLIDLPRIFSRKPLPFSPDFILLPIVAACLAVAMVVTEIFLSNPTRYKANRRVLPRYLWGAFGTGIIAGLVASAFTWVLYKTSVAAWIVRIVAWSLIGLFTGLGESVSWRFRSIEGGTSKANKRLWRGTLYGLGAGFAAAILIEILRLAIELEGYEGPIGFLILGLSLGLFLSFATSPTYQVALRAGEGFEAIDPTSGSSRQDRPRLKPPLRFVTGEHYDIIEEGLSIELPSTTSKPLVIGSNSDADIYIPKIPAPAATLTIKERNVSLLCLAERAVQVQARFLVEGSKSLTLRHNQILTFYHAGDQDKYYRFVFYDRFLDPEA